MNKVDAVALYHKVKKRTGFQIYSEEIHCPMIIEVMANEGTRNAFLVRSEIGKSTFHEWVKRYPIFSECYEIGKAISIDNWEKMCDVNKLGDEFNFDAWKYLGAIRYGISQNSNRIKLEVDTVGTPYEIFQQIIKQACNGDFSAYELSQVITAINSGTAAFNSFELQSQISEIRDNFLELSKDDGERYSSTDSVSEETDNAAL